MAIIEWPDRAGDRLPTEAIRIVLAEEGEGRTVRIEACRHVSAGDRYEVIRPGYQIVRDQMA